MKLVIVESPAKAKKIQDYLGDEYKVLASFGHISSIYHKYNKIGVDVSNNYLTRYRLSSDKIEVLQRIFDVAKESDEILIASDPDREGEAIAWHLKERLKDFDKPIYRIEFNEIKKNKILESLSNKREVDLHLFKAQESRAILDIMIGFAASGYLRNKFEKPMSAGRVQSVVVKIILEKELEINNFKKETYYKIYSNCKDNGIKFSPELKKSIKDLKEAESLKKLIESSGELIVSSIKSKKEQMAAPPPFVTSTLQQYMSKKHNFSAEKTMTLAQSLYEMGFCTYIRTDSVRASEESIKEAKLFLKKENLSNFTKINNHLNKSASQDAHECIRPSDFSINPNENYALSNSDEKLLYKVIHDRFLASQMGPAIYNSTKIILTLNGNEVVKFSLSGRSLEDPGFLNLLGYKDVKVDLPNLKEKQLLKINSVDVNKKETQPPLRFSEDRLIKELVNKNIGRPSTYASLLSKIETRGYVNKNKNIYTPTKLAYEIVDLLNEFPFMDISYTAELEDELDKIAIDSSNHFKILDKYLKNEPLLENYYN